RRPPSASLREKEFPRLPSDSAEPTQKRRPRNEPRGRLSSRLSGRDLFLGERLVERHDLLEGGRAAVAGVPASHLKPALLELHLLALFEEAVLEVDGAGSPVDAFGPVRVENDDLRDGPAAVGQVAIHDVEVLVALEDAEVEVLDLIGE